MSDINPLASHTEESIIKLRRIATIQMGYTRSYYPDNVSELIRTVTALSSLTTRCDIELKRRGLDPDNPIIQWS